MYSDQYGDLHEPIDLSELQKLKFMRHSTKVIWLSTFLKQLLGANTSDKIVIVSQFVDVILKISEVLTTSRIPFQTCKYINISYIYYNAINVYTNIVYLCVCLCVCL